MKKRIKNCFILLVSIILVVSTCSTAMIASAAITEGFTCDFESLKVGTEVTSDIAKSIGWNGASGALGTIVEDAEHGKCLHWTSSQKAGFNLGLGGEIKSGIVKISFAQKRTTDVINNMIGIHSSATAYTIDGTSGVDRATLAYFDQTLTPTSNGASGGKQSGDCVTQNLNTWYTLSFEINMDTRKFVCYVNDTPSKKSYDLCISEDKGIQSVYFYNNAAANIYIDDIVVEHDDKLVASTLGFTCDFNNFATGEITNSGMKAMGWNTANDSKKFGTIKEDADGNRYLCWDSSAEGGFDLFDKNITSGIVKISFLYQRNSELSTAINSLQISSKAGAYDGAATGGVAGTDRTVLTYMLTSIKPTSDGTSSGVQTGISLASGKWYKIVYELDMDNKRYTFSVGDTALGVYYNFPENFSSVRSLFFFMNQNASHCMDDIVVTYEKNGSDIDSQFALGSLQIEKDGTEITAPVTAGDEINVSVKALNAAGGTKKLTLVYASYNGGELVDVKLLPVSVAASSNAQKIVSDDYTVKSGITVTETKAFIWDNASNLTPLSASVKY